jgi:hypothetical protein
MTVSGTWHRFVFHEYKTTRRSLSVYRLLVAIFFITLYVPRYLWISEFPDSFFNPPPGLTSFLFTGFPPHAFFVRLNVILITAIVYLLAGRRVTMATLALVAALLIGNSWAYSFGKIDHDILIVIAPLFLLAAGWDGAKPGSGVATCAVGYGDSSCDVHGSPSESHDRLARSDDKRHPGP